MQREEACGAGSAMVNCSEVQCEGLYYASSVKVNILRRSALANDKLVVKALRR